MSNPRHQTQTTGHRYALNRLSSYMDGQLPDRERARVQAHLNACPDCRQELRTLRWTQNLAQQMPIVPVPRSFIVREADLEAHHIAQPRPLLVPTLARLQTAAAIVAVLLVMVVAGDLLVTRGPLMSRQGGAPMESAAPEPGTLSVAQVPEDMQTAPPVEQAELAPDTPEIKLMVAPTETLTITLVKRETEKVLDTPTADAAANNDVEPSPTPPPPPTWTPTKAGHTSEIASTKDAPTATATASPPMLAPDTPTPTEVAPPTPVPAATATGTATVVPTDPPTHTPTSEGQTIARVPDEATPIPIEDEGVGSGKAQADRPERTLQGQGWRMVQIGLGVVLAGLLIAILWLRRWGRLG